MEFFLLLSSVLFSDEVLYKVSLGATISGLFFTTSDFCLDNGYRLKNAINSLKHNSIQHDSIKRLESHINRFIVIGTIAFILGVFLFLIIAIYYDEKYIIFRTFKRTGNRLTIIAFALVILNYWLKDWCIDWYAEKEKLYVMDKNDEKQESIS